MKTGRSAFTKAGLAALVACAVVCSAPAMAAAAKAGANERQTSDKPLRARCPYGIATDGSSNCMTQADFTERRSIQAAFDRDPAQYKRNALARCEGLSGNDRQDCISRIDGKGTTSGSVEGGGIYRELVTREVGVPAAAVPIDADK